MNGQFDPVIMALAVCVGTLTTYSTISIAARIAAKDLVPWKRLAWLVGASCVAGNGIWSIHFICMVGYRFAIDVGWASGPTLLSWALAVCSTAIGLRVACEEQPANVRFVRSGLLMGIGIVLMQYLGILAIQLSPPIDFSPGMVGLSVLGCILVASAAIVLVHRLRQYWGQRLAARLFAALAVGFLSVAALSIAWEAIRIAPDAVSLAAATHFSTASQSPVLLAVALAITNLMVIGGTHVIAYTGSRAERQVSALLGRLEEAHQRLSWLARHDPLTKLPNRVMLGEQMQAAFARARRAAERVAVLFVDLDGFKPVNDNLGHHVGDAVLRVVGMRLREQLRQSDVLARVGGDEFVVLMERVSDSRTAQQTSERLIQAVSRPIAHEGQEILISASIGIAFFPDDGDETHILVAADVAMYEAKQAGRATWRCYSREMERDARNLVELQRELHHALERGEFELYYQPKYDLRTRSITSVEALIRWNHPTDGLRLPGRFIAAAERLGLINQIGDWVIEAACRQAALWQLEGRPLCVAFNLSPQQFRQRDLVARIAATALRHGALPSGLSIEITESMAMADAAFTRESIAHLNQEGIQAAIDDFGIGYSCLACLRDMPVRQLKIDASFIADLGERPRAEAIVRAIIELGHSLDLEVVAEGVETPLQAKLLGALGCDVLQGYLLAPPLPAAKLEALLAGPIELPGEARAECA